MGVRFLSVEELIRELIPAAYGQTEEVPHNADRGSASPFPETSGEEEIPEPPLAAPEPPVPAVSLPRESPREVTPPRTPLREPSRPVAAPSRQEGPAAPFTATGASFSIRFANREEFLEVYRRDILQGGLFVATRYPARL